MGTLSAIGGAALTSCGCPASHFQSAHCTSGLQTALTNHFQSAHCAEDAPLCPFSLSPQYTLLRNSRASPRRFRASSSIFFFQLVLLLGLLLAAVPLGYVVSR